MKPSREIASGKRVSSLDGFVVGRGTETAEAPAGELGRIEFLGAGSRQGCTGTRCRSPDTEGRPLEWGCTSRGGRIRRQLGGAETEGTS